MRFLDHEVKALRALVTRELTLLGLLNTKEMETNRLIQHYRTVITMNQLASKLQRSDEGRSKIRETAAAGSDDHQPT